MPDEPLTLAAIRHCHRGFTGPTLQSMVEEMSSFLVHHPDEVIVLGINNMFGIDGAKIAAVARLVVKVRAFCHGYRVECVVKVCSYARRPCRQ